MPHISTGRIVSQSELAEIWGKNPATIRAWVRAGCPIIKKGRGGARSEYNTADVAAWREQQAALGAGGDLNAMDIDEARRRKTAAEAALAELELAIKKGRYVEIEEVGSAVAEEYAEVRAKLLSLPSDMADSLQHLTVAETQEALAAKISEILHVLSVDGEYGAEAPTEEGAAEQSETAAPAQSG